jgi:hypothetical protein
MKHLIQYSEHQKRNGYVNSTQGDTTSTTDSESRKTFKRARQSTLDSSIQLNHIDNFHDALADYFATCSVPLQQIEHPSFIRLLDSHSKITGKCKLPNKRNLAELQSTCAATR